MLEQPKCQCKCQTSVHPSRVKFWPACMHAASKNSGSGRVRVSDGCLKKHMYLKCVEDDGLQKFNVKNWYHDVSQRLMQLCFTKQFSNFRMQEFPIISWPSYRFEQLTGRSEDPCTARNYPNSFFYPINTQRINNLRSRNHTFVEERSWGCSPYRNRPYLSL